MRLLIFGGTTEGRLLAEALAGTGIAVTVSVATDLGREELEAVDGITVEVGRKNGGELAALIAGCDLCVDATHPYAVEVSRLVKAACAETGVPLRRLLREKSSTEGTVQVDSCRSAAAFLAGTDGNILLATGAKELSAFGALEKGRLFARVLPTHDGIAACEALGLAHRQILALQGPFTVAMNTAMLEQYAIAWLVTKDGGGAGGFLEKQTAAKAAGARLLVIGRPVETGETMDEILNAIREGLSWR
ncbi:MAG: precorrin-6A reductase [Oscillospiraceae bacterium]